MSTPTIRLLSILAIASFGLAACGGGKSSNSNATNATKSEVSAAPAMTAGGASNATIPNCGAVQAVWVNLNSKVYHEPGDPAYGKTKRGEYLCPSQATAQGFRAAGGESSGGRRHQRHKGTGNSSM
jgi:hypothetical protein